MRKTSISGSNSSNLNTPTASNHNKLTPSSSGKRTVSRTGSKVFQLDDDQTPAASIEQSITSVEWLRRLSSANGRVLQLQRQVSKSSDNNNDRKEDASIKRDNATPRESVVDEDAAKENETDIGESEPENTTEQDQDADDDEDTPDDDTARSSLATESPEPVKKPKKKLGILEYDLEYMYPEINVLVRSKKRDWDFSDPDVIRALWLEAKTGILSDWRVKAAKIDFRKNPKIEVRPTSAENLRREYLMRKADEALKSEETDFYRMNAGKEEPVFGPINILSNLTTDMRFKYIRNNPPVPARFIEHFSKYRKPPFTLNAAPCKN